MPVSKKKPTTFASEVSTAESLSNAMPEPEDFRQYLRRLAVSAVQVLIEQVMREELEQCIGARLWENAHLIVAAIAMVLTPAIW